MTNNKKINVGILFGGKSAEHEVSLQSAKNVIEAINRDKYNPILIGIDKKGEWMLSEGENFILNDDDPSRIHLNQASDRVAIIPESHGVITDLSNPSFKEQVDVVFPILHGPLGEDGTIQGLLKLAGIPFVGAGVLGSAVGMDKDIMKRLLKDAGIPIGKYMTFKDYEALPSFQEIKDYLGKPLFVKPANMGSSVGVSKVGHEKEWKKAIQFAFRYDRKVVVEEFIDGREIECAVLGNNNPKASLPGEVIAQHDFYSYDAKYIDESGAILVAPAELDGETVKKVQDLAVRTFKTLECEGLGRVDVFLKPSGEIIVNEINTIPGFTKISMYPRLWGVTGISYTDLIDQLIQLAMERFEKEKKLKTGFLA